jgi:hypothetical protein
MFSRLVFLLFIAILPLTIGESILREYVIRKDFFNSFKAGQFSIYDQTGKILLYRIESEYAFMHTIKLIAYPSRKVIGRLKGKWHSLVYQATLEITNTDSQRPIRGTIIQNLQLLGVKYTISWNEMTITMDNELASLTTRFYDEDANGIMMAQFEKKLESFIFANQYNMEVYSDDVPDAIYLLSLAAKDHNLLKISKG